MVVECGQVVRQAVVENEAVAFDGHCDAKQATTNHTATAATANGR